MLTPGSQRLGILEPGYTDRIRSTAVRHGRGLMRSTKAFLIGAGTAYLLDPGHGRRRRHVLRDRSRRIVRVVGRRGASKARFTSGRLRGTVASFRRLVTPADVAVDDVTVIQRIRSDAFRRAGVSTRDVELRVEDGVATISGSVDSSEHADALVQRVAKTPGVSDVAAMLRISGDTDAETEGEAEAA
jgi:BON domain